MKTKLCILKFLLIWLSSWHNTQDNVMTTDFEDQCASGTSESHNDHDVMHQTSEPSTKKYA